MVFEFMGVCITCAGMEYGDVVKVKTLVAGLPWAIRRDLVAVDVIDRTAHLSWDAGVGRNPQLVDMVWRDIEACGWYRGDSTTISIAAVLRFAKRLERVDVPLVRDHAERLWPGSISAAPWPQDVLCRCARVGIESPIEAIFLMAWEKVSLHNWAAMRSVHLVPQAEQTIEGQLYRFDFLIMPAIDDDAQASHLTAGRMVIVEVDGHEFHERTKEQVAYRNARDRAVQRAGFTVCHYAGSEVVRDPEGCVRDAWVTAQREGLHTAAARLSSNR